MVVESLFFLWPSLEAYLALRAAGFRFHFLYHRQIRSFVTLWKRRVNDKRLVILLLLSENLKPTPHVDISEQIFNHLEQFLQAFYNYFPEDPCLKKFMDFEPICY